MSVVFSLTSSLYNQEEAVLYYHFYVSAWQLHIYVIGVAATKKITKRYKQMQHDAIIFFYGCREFHLHIYIWFLYQGSLIYKLLKRFQICVFVGWSCNIYEKTCIFNRIFWTISLDQSERWNSIIIIIIVYYLFTLWFLTPVHEFWRKMALYMTYRLQSLEVFSWESVCIPLSAFWTSWASCRTSI